MKGAISAVDIPPGSEISRHMPNAYFHDCYEIPFAADTRSALELYLEVVTRAPAWVDRLMALRNGIVSKIGLKDLGRLGTFVPLKQPDAYRVGDRIGIFSLLLLTHDEVILGDSDKHLDVKVSVHRRSQGRGSTIAISTVVHIHNTLGRVYMLFVGPIHKLIVPAMLRRADLDAHPG